MTRAVATEVRVVFVTAPRDRAPELARALVDRRLCACVNLVDGIRSFYRWEGAVEDDPEALLVIKTTTGVLERLRSVILELHPYDLPEIIALPVTEGHLPYLAWVRDEVAHP